MDECQNISSEVTIVIIVYFRFLRTTQGLAFLTVLAFSTFFICLILSGLTGAVRAYEEPFDSTADLRSCQEN